MNCGQFGLIVLKFPSCIRLDWNMLTKQRSLYDHVLAVAGDYLGPQAKELVDQQIANHLGKSPSELQREDIPELADWLQMVVSLTTGDTNTVEQFTERLHKLEGRG
jgi:hypothetical protein